MKYVTLILILFAKTIFAQSFTIKDKISIPEKVDETSGIILFDKRIVTFNDSGGKPELYFISKKSGKLKKSVKIKGAKNKDWESITQDDDYVYIGDTGNNYGNRQDLVIYKIKKSDLKSKHEIKSEKIHFSYEDQREFIKESHHSNFDCEAITIYNDQILIFTKNWKNYKTNIYTIPTKKGTYIAKKRLTLDINCLLTSADYNKETNTFVGTAYDTDYKSYLILVKDFSLKNKNFTKFELTPELGYANQIESVEWKNNSQIYITREASVKELKKKKYDRKQKLLLINLIN